MKANKVILSLLLVCASMTAALAAPAKPTPAEMAARRSEWMKLTPAEREARVYRATGGFLKARNSHLGKVAIVNTQDKVSEELLKSVAERIALDSKMNFVYCKMPSASPEQLLKETKAHAVIVVVDDPSQPIALIALEDRWAMVNVAKIGRSLKTDEARAKFVPSRTYKEVSRCACLLCGGARSQFHGNILDVKRLEELDLIENGGIPMDRVSAMAQHLISVGLTPEKKVPYRRACEEGWAPAPTNDIQKAIWDKVHQLPTKPIKILPETKPVKE